MTDQRSNAVHKVMVTQTHSAALIGAFLYKARLFGNTLISCEHILLQLL